MSSATEIAERPCDIAPRRVTVLPAALANQIAAGEVIERPASAVKELVENSLDAGATRVFVDIEDGGRDLIRVADDGHGMTREDAVLSLERHATSKIRRVEDLFAINTMGFRGEALPSIASVSRFTLETQEPGSLAGTRVTVEGGEVVEVRDAGMAHGTVVTVRDLFFNTPARLKFLKTTATEVRHISETILRVALANPGVHFRLRHNNRVVSDLPIASNLGDRILAVFDRETRDALFETAAYPPIDGVSAAGFYSRPDFTQRSTNRFYTFVNGRYVKDRTMHAAVKGAYRGVMEKGRFPMVVLDLSVPADLLDVNVHPTKIEVRFTRSDAVYRAIYHAIADALEKTPWVDESERTYILRQRERISGPGDNSLIEPLDARTNQRQLPIGQHRRPAEPLRVPISELFGTSPRPSPSREHTEGDVIEIGGEEPATPGAAEPADSDGYFGRLRFIGQFKRSYLLCEDNSGLVIVDQHAAHERIGFERLRRLYRDNHTESQALLFAERITLDSVRAATMADSVDFFARVGFELSHFGGNDWALKAVPAILVGARYDRLVKDVLDDIGEIGATSRIEEARDAIFARMACHAVIRAGDSVGPTEAQALFTQMDAIDFSANCPHGRPVYYRLPLAELEEAFGR